MPPKATHREVKHPRMSARHLADYMAASDITRRRIVRECKYITLARAFQHDEAKAAVGKFIREGGINIGALLGKAQELKDRIADDDFERNLFDVNADYIERFAEVSGRLTLPAADRLPPGREPIAELNGVRVPIEIHFRLSRVNKRNVVKTGAAMLRYAKGKPLAPEVAAWQSALLFGYLREYENDSQGVPEPALCITIDAQSGVARPAPSDAIRRYNNIKAVCATIAEQWPNIKAPDGAVL